jgi:hypothetical protein
LALTEESETKRIIDAARERGVQLRVIGGMAFKIHCTTIAHRALARTYGDIDLVGYKKQRSEISQILESLGYIPNRHFNALQGHRRLLFAPADEKFDIDVFLDIFPMCHQLSFINRLERDMYTVPLAELLLSKLQVVQLNEKDVKDIYALLQEHEVAVGDDPEIINMEIILQLCGNDWGWYKTVTLNINKILSLVDDFFETDQKRDLVVNRLNNMRDKLERTPKTYKWKLRSIIGEKIRWYELPEDMTGEVLEEGAHRGLK